MTDLPKNLLHSLFESQGRTPFVKELGAEITEAVPGRTTMRLTYSQKLVGNPDTGVVHGGVITGLLDHACGMAVGSALGVAPRFADRQGMASYATLDLRIDYMKAAKPGADIIVVGECVKITHQVVFARGHAYQESADNLIASATGTFIITELRPAAKV